MILTGRIDEKNQLWVSMTVGGLHSKQTIEALIDTGFNGELLLPLQIAIPLGLQLAGAAPYRLADGSISQQMLFTANIGWGTTSRTATVNVVNSDTALIGGGLLHGYILLVDFQKKQLVIKEPGVDEPSPSQPPSKKSKSSTLKKKGGK
ncbi:TPA: hypothetical protein DCY77_00530 [Candidatus Uhrbacteria bacterium]|nr:hypothetical protein [Candidatus Uhrbacteria bacterium]HCM82053.1 hypothetical protein [Patescibacteria group bacterium]